MSELSEKSKPSFLEKDFSIWQALEVFSLFFWWLFVLFNVVRLGGFSFLGGDLGDIAAVATVIALFINVWVIYQTQQELKLDREERQEARDFQAWANITNPDIPGPNKIDDLEYLHKKGRSFAGLPLPEGTNLTGMDRPWQLGERVPPNLQGADLRNADWKGVNLQSACLQKTDFSKANLENANLVNAHFECARLFAANFKGANLSFARFEGANLINANLEGARLSYANFQGANLTGAKMKTVDFKDPDQLKDAYYISEFGQPPSLPEGIKKPKALKKLHAWIEIQHKILSEIED